MTIISRPSSPESPAKEQPGEQNAALQRASEANVDKCPSCGAKLGQGWIPVEWQELGGVPGPENEPAALVAWISVAQKEGVEALFRRMQKRLLLWEREKLSPETYEKIKNWPIYTEPPPPERP